MVTAGITWVIASLVVFVAFSLLVQAEQKRGKRLFLPGLRGWFDKMVARLGTHILETWDHFVKYIVQLGWYYGIHSFLRTVLRTLVALYERLERVFESNRRRAKELRAQKKNKGPSNQSHLTEMARHKADTALTTAQKNKLKKTQLEGE